MREVFALGTGEMLCDSAYGVLVIMKGYTLRPRRTSTAVDLDRLIYYHRQILAPKEGVLPYES